MIKWQHLSIAILLFCAVAWAIPKGGAGAANGDWLVGPTTISSGVWNPKHTDYTPTGTTQTVDLSVGNSFGLSLASASGNVTVTFSGGVVGSTYTIRVLQAAGAPYRNIAWNGGSTTIHWFPGGVVPTITAAASAVDRVSVVCYAADSYELAIAQDGK